jgi:hypothetical protein
MVLTVVSVVGASGLIVPALADAASSSTFPILVMGDSYSAGNGAGDYTGPKGCWRSPNNYAGLYSQALNQPPYDQLSYVASSACSGDKTSSFFSTTSGRAPQLASVNKHYGLILPTIGGDDVGFAGIVQNCLIAAFVNVAKCKALLSEADKLLSDGTIEGRVRRVLSGIRSRADSRAVIALLGYPYLESDAGYVIDKGAPDAFNVGGWLRRIEDKGDAIQERLISELNRHDHTSSFLFVKTKARFKGHELSAESSNPNRWFVEPLTDATIASRFTWYHPNPTGWAEEAKLLLSDPRVPKRDPIGPAPHHSPAAWTTSGTSFSVSGSYSNTQPSGVSCAGPAECVAVGSDFESFDNQFTAVAGLWHGQSWGEMALAETSGIDLFSVSCPTSGFCLAVGRTEFEGNQSSPVAEAWENGVWTTEQPLPSPDGGYANFFGVSCSTSTDCIAVGAQQAGSSTIPFAEHWSSGTWTMTAMSDEGIELLGVSCARTNWCMAVGGTQQGNYGRPLVERWDGYRWTVATVPGPPIIKSNEDTWGVELKSVSCAGAGSCVAVGNAGTILQWDGRIWTLGSAQGGTRVNFAGVSCASAIDCAAVGGGTHGPVIENKSGSRWNQERQALGPKTTLTDIALPTGGGAIAIGYQTTTNTIYPIGERRP